MLKLMGKKVFTIFLNEVLITNFIWACNNTIIIILTLAVICDPLSLTLHELYIMLTNTEVPPSYQKKNKMCI